MSDISIHLWDAARPDDEDSTFPVCIYSEAIPRVGDEVCYWVDYPHHMFDLSDTVRAAPGEPEKVTGIVKRVRIDYRVMRGWGGADPHKVVPMVAVYLDNYHAVPFPAEAVCVDS